MVGTQERVIATFALDCHELRECFLIRPPVFTRPMIESRNIHEYSNSARKVLLKLTVKKRV